MGFGIHHFLDPPIAYPYYKGDLDNIDGGSSPKTDTVDLDTGGSCLGHGGHIALMFDE